MRRSGKRGCLMSVCVCVGACVYLVLCVFGTSDFYIRILSVLKEREVRLTPLSFFLIPHFTLTYGSSEKIDILFSASLSSQRTGEDVFLYLFFFF